jgi:serine/threonine-protein kinase
MPASLRDGAAVVLPTPGQIIAGKYAIVKVLGEGGMGIVYEATHVKLRQRVAVKMLQPQMLAHEIIVTRFEREARASGQLRNRHAARVMDVDVTAEGLPYMVMEFLEGHDLQVELERRGRLSHEEAVDYMLQACSAMIEAHQLGIVHRDLKPANLFLALDGESHIVKVLDFGISKVKDEGDARLTEAESVIGTAMYMSPEQLRSSQTVDARTDIWSLGIILYELLAGRPPWVGSPTQLAAAIVSDDAPDVRTYGPVPAELAAIVAKALRRNPAERFADVKQLAVALAPHAPISGPGRVLADGLLNSASGIHGRVSIRPSARLEEAQTIVQAAAISQSREGTAPGWSQQSQPTTRKRTVLIGFVAAFAVGLVVVGGLAAVWLDISKSASTNAQTTSSSSGAAAAAAALAPPSAEPIPPQLDPAPPVTGQGSSPAPPTSVAVPTSRPRGPVGRPASPGANGRPAAPAQTPAKPATPSTPSPPATVNPLTL